MSALLHERSCFIKVYWTSWEKRKNARLMTYNNAGAWMLDSFHHTALKLIKNRILAWKRQVLSSFTQWYNERLYVPFLICKPLVVYRFYCMALYHSLRQGHVQIKWCVLVIFLKKEKKAATNYVHFNCQLQKYSSAFLISSCWNI